VTWAETLGRLEPETVARAAALWGVDAGSLEFVSRSANAVYRFRTQGQVRYLRLVHRDLRDEAFLAAGVDWARHLAANGVWVSAPIASVNGNLIENTVQDKYVFLSTVRNGVAGAPLGNDLGSDQLEAWGFSLGLLHAASALYKAAGVQTPSGMVKPESFSLRQFWANIATVISRNPDLVPAYTTLGAWLEGLPNTDLILTHGDFRPTNAIWDGSRVHVVDFDEPTLAWAEYDIARAMMRDNDGLFPNHAAHLETFLRGYTQVRAVNASLVARFVQLRALLMLAWSLEDESWGWTTTLRDLAVNGLEG
jgi:Ser/Thr protein kinase RdoA (MazF antagonist)